MTENLIQWKQNAKIAAVAAAKEAEFADRGWAATLEVQKIYDREAAVNAAADPQCGPAINVAVNKAQVAAEAAGVEARRAQEVAIFAERAEHADIVTFWMKEAVAAAARAEAAKVEAVGAATEADTSLRICIHSRQAGKKIKTKNNKERKMRKSIHCERLCFFVLLLLKRKNLKKENLKKENIKRIFLLKQL